MFQDIKYFAGWNFLPQEMLLVLVNDSSCFGTLPRAVHNSQGSVIDSRIAETSGGYSPKSSLLRCPTVPFQHKKLW
jgi:hypothetical protein